MDKEENNEDDVDTDIFNGYVLSNDFCFNVAIKNQV